MTEPRKCVHHENAYIHCGNWQATQSSFPEFMLLIDAGNRLNHILDNRALHEHLTI